MKTMGKRVMMLKFLSWVTPFNFIAALRAYLIFFDGQSGFWLVLSVDNSWRNLCA